MTVKIVIYQSWKKDNFCHVFLWNIHQQPYSGNKIEQTSEIIIQKGNSMKVKIVIK